ncbi:hypothetical protein, partial [Pseudomonas mandelii]|uniref:hypothetical protein n=1 Tax=Pseudomonas mandelii TaxID=75612 RepID=UPI00224AF1E4
LPAMDANDHAPFLTKHHQPQNSPAHRAIANVLFVERVAAADRDPAPAAVQLLGFETGFAVG